MRILAIDPGNEQSAYVLLKDGYLVEFGKLDNEQLLGQLPSLVGYFDSAAIEMVACYGMPVGKEVFDTALWVGRYKQKLVDLGRQVDLVFRKDVKMHLCCTLKGVNDATIRQALIDRYGPGKDKAIGTKKAPGPLYGVSKDVWAALAVGVTWLDQAKTPQTRTTDNSL